ncbi:MAG: type II secretion system F family protein [Candidatus Pacebacteria bacterium]|nr:type II secretion system F family protein [Candidatus Paceibacterota bacterium]
MKFSYQARTKQGENKKGVIEASSRKAALEILEKYGFYVTFLQELKSKTSINIELPFLPSVSQKDLVAFARQFAVMLKSAIPPLQSLKAQANQARNKKLQEVILKMAQGIETGSPLSQVFALHPKIFSPFFISIIKSGEATGKVADSLTYLADHLEREYNFNQKVRGAMIYPAFVVAVFIGAFFLTTFFIVPKLTEILQSFSGKLPLATRIMISLSGFVRQGGWVVILVVSIILFLSPMFFKRNKKTQPYYDKFVLRLPIFGAFTAKVNLVRFAENLSVLISAGLPITQALSITRDIMTNSVYKNIIKKTEERVAKGEKISSVTVEYPRSVPPFVTQMIATGEETGRLEETLMDAVNFYRQETERTASNLTTIIEPLLILVMGIGIAVLAVSIFIPLFKIGMGGAAGM